MPLLVAEAEAEVLKELLLVEVAVLDKTALLVVEAVLLVLPELAVDEMDNHKAKAEATKVLEAVEAEETTVEAPEVIQDLTVFLAEVAEEEITTTSCLVPLVLTETLLEALDLEMLVDLNEVVQETVDQHNNLVQAED